MLLLSVFILLFCTPLVTAEEFEDDIEIFGLELEKVFYFGSAIIATVLFIVSLIAHIRTEKLKLLFIWVAFLLFAIKGFLISHELFIAELSFVDPVASILDFIIVLIFLFGMLKK
ncbi:hypothetical protein COV18_01575 [Candidatus Woesearchaeota archaeon CG10_big_fil_rev_8_21_14_0_10_37_12]|nr:MAG: hypothetical protein COV18_01575 [Candidatus Woesearchaeota archaeon CG10_big_fil_rev_8_21_14_0_10_37_12]